MARNRLDQLPELARSGTGLSIKLPDSRSWRRLDFARQGASVTPTWEMALRSRSRMFIRSSRLADGLDWKVEFDVI